MAVCEDWDEGMMIISVHKYCVDLAWAGPCGRGGEGGGGCARTSVMDTAIQVSADPDPVKILHLKENPIFSA
jgi:hypothetical protein